MNRIYVRGIQFGAVFAIEVEGERFTLVGCDDPCLVSDGKIRHGEINIVFGRTYTGYRCTFEETSNPECSLILEKKFGYITTPHEAYHLACQNAPTRSRFPLRFIVQAGGGREVIEAIEQRWQPDDREMADEGRTTKVTISSVLDRASRGLVIRHSYEKLGRRWTLIGSDRVYTLHKGPAGWDKAIRAALGWWEYHRPDA